MAQVAAASLKARVLERLLALLLPINSCWLAAMVALGHVRRALRWTFGTL